MPDNQTFSHSQSLIRRIISIFWLWFNLRLNNFLLTHKISEQQINSKVLSVASSLNYNGNSKNGKIVYEQMPAPRKLSQQIPAPRAKANFPQGGGKFFGANPLGCAGGMVIDEIDTLWLNRKLYQFSAIFDFFHAEQSLYSLIPQNRMQSLDLHCQLVLEGNWRDYHKFDSGPVFS